MNWNHWMRQIHRWLLFMTITGLYMFALPYVAKWRTGQRGA